MMMDTDFGLELIVVVAVVVDCCYYFDVDVVVVD